MNVKQFIRTLPKAELHVHIEGVFEPELTFEVAKHSRIAIPYENVEAIRQAYNFHNLQSFLGIHHAGADVLLQEADFYDLIRAYFEHYREDSVVHTKIFFDPQTYTAWGMVFKTIINDIVRAYREAG